MRSAAKGLLLWAVMFVGTVAVIGLVYGNFGRGAQLLTFVAGVFFFGFFLGRGSRGP
jgi:hypothetical protein